MRVNLQLSALCAAVCAIATAGKLGSKAKTRAPNIVLYLADDMGLGVVNQHAPEWSLADDPSVLDDIPEARRIQTPTLERMAREGKRMMRSYAASSVCGPSRHALMTGIQVGASELRGNGFGEDSSDVDIADGLTTMAAVLSSAGYRTGAVGKWGMATNETASGSPCRHGFETFYGKFTHASMGSGFPLDMFSCTSAAPGSPTRHMYPHNVDSTRERCVAATDAGSPCSHMDRLVRDQALAFVREQKNDERPFFLYWATSAGHSALYGDEDKFANCRLKTHPVPSFGRYTAEALAGTGRTTESILGLMAMIEYTVDEDLRQLLETLEVFDPDENTLVIVASDNGPHQEAFMDAGYDPHRDLVATAGLGGIKRRMLEGGLRSPTIAWWPGHIPAGSTSSYPMMHYDLPLTLAEVGGVASDDTVLAPLKTQNAGGVSLAALLTAASDSTGVVSNATRPWTYSEICFPRAGKTRKGVVCPIQWVQNIGCAYALYDLTAWPRQVTKLVQNKPQDAVAMYDVTADPFEQDELLNARSDETNRLVALREALRTPLCALEDGYEPACYEDVCNMHKTRSRCNGDVKCRRKGSTCVSTACSDLGFRSSTCRKRDDCLWSSWILPRGDRCSDRPGSDADALSAAARSASADYEEEDWNGAVPFWAPEPVPLAEAFRRSCQREESSASCARNQDCEWLSGACEQRACEAHGYRKVVCKSRPDCAWNWRTRPRQDRCTTATGTSR